MNILKSSTYREAQANKKLSIFCQLAYRNILLAMKTWLIQLIKQLPVV
jgi:hypothetical protein